MPLRSAWDLLSGRFWRIIVGVSLSPVERGRSALRAGDLAAARTGFETAVAENASGEALEGLAEVQYAERDYPAAAASYEQAFLAYRREHDHLAASRAARSMAWITGNVQGDWAVQGGWYARALTILESAPGDGPARGWELIVRAYTEPDASVREELLHEAVSIGRSLGDADMEFEALSYLGGVYVMTDRVEEGLILLDESLAAVCAGELSEIATMDAIFCGFFWACELVHDVPRADQWMRAAEHVIAKRNVVAAFCRAHYGGILTAAGRWSEAEAELAEASRYFALGISRRETPMIRLADLRVRQGRLEEAQALLAGLEDHPDAVGALAALRLARGETALARDLLERATRAPDEAVPTVGEFTMVGPLLSLLVEACLEGGDLDAAADAADRLERLASAQRGLYLKAAAALARGRLCLATGTGDARACLLGALEAFVRAQLPVEVARTRLALAQSVAATSPEVAVAEARTALESFERLDAARDADVAGALLRALGAPVRTGPKGVGVLTKRETEVLGLLGAGLSNPEIAARLFITRKTVEHHVGTLLAKLGLRNRAEAAAFAARQSLGRPMG